MDSFEILVSHYLLEKASGGLIAVVIIVAVIIALTVIFSVKSVKNQEAKNDNISSPLCDDKMSASDHTD